MTVDLVLYQPDIAQNTGTLLRLGACLGVAVHIVHPTGFPFSRRQLKRGGLDYLDHAEIIEHDNYDHFDRWRRGAGRRLVLVTTKSPQTAYAFTYSDQDLLMLGRESAGVPEAVADSADARIRIPMRSGLRSINVAVAGAMVVGEALRQTNRYNALA
jgi:tRNA (cytidine/uridine-2'-O-)-methyltransferase